MLKYFERETVSEKLDTYLFFRSFALTRGY